MANDGVVSVDPLFVGLTRKAMFLGVSYMYVMANMLVCMLYFIYFSSFKVVFVFVVVHGFGYIICFKEPLFLEIYSHNLKTLYSFKGKTKSMQL